MAVGSKRLVTYQYHGETPLSSDSVYAAYAAPRCKPAIRKIRKIAEPMATYPVGSSDNSNIVVSHLSQLSLLDGPALPLISSRADIDRCGVDHLTDQAATVEGTKEHQVGPIRGRRAQVIDRRDVGDGNLGVLDDASQVVCESSRRVMDGSRRGRVCIDDRRCAGGSEQEARSGSISLYTDVIVVGVVAIVVGLCKVNLAQRQLKEYRSRSSGSK